MGKEVEVESVAYTIDLYGIYTYMKIGVVTWSVTLVGSVIFRVRFPA